MKPVAAGHLLATLLRETPPRLVKRLEAEPEMAAAWEWRYSESGCEVRTSGGETVTLGSVLERMEDLRCTCLLAPRCLHRLAVLALLPAAETAPAEADPAQTIGELNQQQRSAVQALLELGSRVARVGGTACGLVEQAEAQQVAFQCRQCGLHRAGAAATRLLTSLRQLRAGSREYSQESLALHLREVLEVAVHLQVRPEPEWLGQARRSYAPAGSLKLWGLFSEAVLTASGYAGCVTTLCDREGRFYTVSDIAPGEAERTQQAYRAGSTLPGLSVGHQQLGRHIVLVQSATLSDEGRLGAGQGVSAVLSAPSSWDDLQHLWGQRHGDLLFVEAAVAGIQGEALLLDNGIRLLASSQLTVENLRLLARLEGQPLRWIGRMHPRLERTLEALAVSGDFPWGDRANLGLDRLVAAHFPQLAARPKELEASAEVLPWSALEGRLWRIAEGGRNCAQPDPAACRQWRDHQLPGADRLWRALVAAGQTGSRDLRGLWQPDPTPRFALHWLAAMRYLETGRQTWLQHRLT